MPETVTYLIAKLPPADSLPDYGLAWWDMTFTRVNDKPVPHKTKEDAQRYIDTWGLAALGFEIYELRKV